VHEVSLVEQLIGACIEQAAGRPVGRVRVRHASTIPAEGLHQAFEMLSRNTPLADATLEAETFALRLECGCGFEGPLGHDDVISGSVAVCPACGDVSTQRRTAELELLEIS
jgi:Zn finger protein HypA/HybF involved in hydrogenase expression